MRGLLLTTLEQAHATGAQRLPVLRLSWIQMMNGSKSVRDTKGIFLLKSGVTEASNSHWSIVSPRAMLSHGSITSGM